MRGRHFERSGDLGSEFSEGYASLVTPNVKLGEIPDEGVRARVTPAALAAAAGLFALALVPRLLVVFFVTDPQNPGLGWYGDVFHHWQIAYLSKEIGFSHGFLRLWDFKGLEFFWGLLHPLILVGLFTITGSVDIVIPRLLSAITASISLALLFFLLKRNFNPHVALAGTILAILNPIAVYNDGVGMQEPLGILLLFLGLTILERQPVLTGILWAMAGMVRAEYWVFGAGLVAVAIISRRHSRQITPLVVGWLIPSLAYMKYMAANTGNPIYPIYWNFLAGTAGEWMADIPLNPEQVTAQLGARIVLVLACLAAWWLVARRPKSLLLLSFGLGNIIMLGIVLGLGEYVRGYVSRVLIDRLLVVPYMYLGIFLAVGVLHALPSVAYPRISRVIGWSAIVLVLIMSQLAWQPILNTYRPLNEIWVQEKELGQQLASYYEGGTILIPEDRQGLTYALVRYHGLLAGSLEGQMYDPFSYMSGDPFTDWTKNRTVVKDWLVSHDIRLILFYDGKSTYERMIQLEPDWFDYQATVHRGTLDIYRVTVSDS